MQYRSQGRFFSDLGMEFDWIPMPACAVYIVKTTVFLRFSSFWQSWDLWQFGKVWDLILTGSWVPWVTWWWFGIVLGACWNLEGFWNLPWDHPGGEHQGHWWLNPPPWAPRKLPITSLLTPEQPLDRKPDHQIGIWEPETGNKNGKQKICRLQSFPSQPGGP